MTKREREQANITVPDALKTARWYAELFGWRILWSASSIYWGTSVHVGTDKYYIAIHSLPDLASNGPNRHRARNHAHHVRIVAEDFDTIRGRAALAGYMIAAPTGCNMAECFDFHDEHGVEFEVVSSLKRAA